MVSAKYIDPDQPAQFAQASPGRRIPSLGDRGIDCRDGNEYSNIRMLFSNKNIRFQCTIFFFFSLLLFSKKEKPTIISKILT